MEATQDLLDYAGIGRERLRLGWVSAAEGQRFAELVREITDVVTSIGPFDAEAHATPLEAVLRTLETETVRWLIGMERALTERGNVYGEKLSPSTYEQLLVETLQTEYRKNLIYLSLREGPLSVREIDARTRVGIQAVSSLLAELEGQGQVEFHGYEGRTPRFAAVLA
jgi:DNA-binding transcriptional ArsR family regulator